MHHHEITSIGTSITLVIIKLMTLDTIRVQEHEQERDKMPMQLKLFWDSDNDPILAKCPQSFTPDGLLLANCSGDYDDLLKDQELKSIIIPRSLPTNIQAIDLSQYGGSKDAFVFLTGGGADFANYPKLQRIIIKRSKQFSNEDPEIKSISQKALAISFKNLSSLECLEFTSSSLTDDFPITLPKNLKTLIINHNLYTSLNVVWCEKLTELDANYNGLTKMPKFHVPNPPLRTLRLKRNPLKDMTVRDIAPFCNLTLLELEFPPKSHYLTEAGYCQCTMLKNWVEEFEIKGAENVKCAASNKNCSEKVLQEARTLHSKCPAVKKNTTAVAGAAESGTTSKFLKITFFIFLGLLLASLMIYLARYLYLMAGDNETEEEEEEDDERGSSSEIETGKPGIKLYPAPKVLSK